MTDFPLAPTLPGSTLDRARSLPRRPAPVTLTGSYINLVPLDLERDTQALFEISNGGAVSLGEHSIDHYDSELLIWRYMSGGPFSSASELAIYLEPQIASPNGLCMCVFDQATGQPVGVTNYMNNFPEHLKIELGGIWYSPLVQRTKANAEATYLMLNHAFDLGYRRVEWKCDALNERSRRAALRMGFKFEGIQEHHFIIKGRNRDTAWFRLLDHEWEETQHHLKALLYT